MDIVALCLWVLTALAGLTILGAWIAAGGVRRASRAPGRHRRLPPALVFGHLLLAAGGLAVWALYLALQQAGLAWAALGTLLVVATLGLIMFARWVPSYRSRVTLGVAPGGAHRAPPEQNLPVAVVLGHGVLAVSTVVLVLLVAIGLG